MNQILLPKVYLNDASGNYAQHVNKPKISYSQYTSWKELIYRQDYITQYFLGKRQEPGIYAQFGSACGGYFEDLTIDSKWLSHCDVKVLERLERPEGATYEGEIVIDRGSYVIQGFIDQEFLVNGKLFIKDLKTGNVDSKVKFYGGPDYQQTTVYSHARKLEGFDIGYSGVMLLGRKGNGTNYGPLRLSGVIEHIETPYSEERAKKALASIDATVFEISNAYKLFKKLNK